MCKASLISVANLARMLVAVTMFSLLAFPNCSVSGQVSSKKPPPKSEGSTPLRGSAKSQLKIIGETTKVLDPVCNACKGAELSLSLYNGTAGLAPLALRVEHLTSDPAGDAANVRISVGSAKEPLAFPLEIKPGSLVAFVVTVRGVLGPGKWKAELYNGDTHLGMVSFIVPDVPLHLKLDTADPNQPSITVTRREQSTLLLKNEDSVGYSVEWEYRLGPELSSSEKKNGKIPGGGSLILEIQPKEEWFQEAQVSPCPWYTGWTEYFRVPCHLRAIFKDDQAEGLLTIRLHSDDCPEDAGAPMKIFRVKTTLAYYGASSKVFWSYLVLIVLLVLGALCSLYVNYKFPDEQIRSDLRRRLKEISDGIEGLSMRLASRLRVLVGVERRVLSERLRALRWYHTDFETQRSNIDNSTTQLRRRLDLLDRMGRLRDEYQHLTTYEVPPTILDRLENLFEQTVSLLNVFRPSDTDLQDAELKLAEIRKTLSGWTQADAAFAAQIASALRSLYNDLQPPAGTLTNSKALTSLRPQFANLINALATTPPDATQIPPNEYYRRDCLVFRGSLLKTYANLCDTRNPEADSPLVTRQPDLIKMLKTESWDGLQRARRLVREMSEEIYAEDIKREIEAKRVEVRLDRNQIRVFEAAQFDLKFHIQKFDSAAARDKWSCTWNFGHGPFLGKKDDTKNYLEEDGWSVAHYYPDRDNYSIRVRFRHEENGDLKDSRGEFITTEKEIFVGPSGEQIDVTGRAAWLKRRWQKPKKWLGENGNAIARLALALVPAIVALTAGAKEQVLKLDLFPALCAVFLAGFGSDQVKNLLSQKPKT